MRRRESCARRRPWQQFEHAPVVLPGIVLAAVLLTACSSGPSFAASSGSRIPGASTTTTPGAAGETTRAAAETPTQEPAPLPVGAPVATDTPSPRTTEVVLSFLGWDNTTAAVEAGGYLSPVVESGGTCTLELTKGSQTVTVVAPAQADATTTSCGDLAVPRARLTPGGWSAVLRYASKTTAGASDPAPVVVPQ